MDKNDIIDYVMHTPHNTNKAVLSGMLNQLTEGSGGSSDFSTAEVTTIGTSQIVYNVWMPLISDEEGYTNIYAGTVSITSLNGPSGITVTVPLYKGSMAFDLPEGYSGTPTITGAATVHEYGFVTVTGDCTITI